MLPPLHQVVRTACETLHKLRLRLQAKAEDGRMSPSGSRTGVSFLEEMPEMKLLSESLRETSVHPRLWLEDEAAAYAASRMLFVQPGAEEEALPLGEFKRLSLL